MVKLGRWRPSWLSFDQRRTVDARGRSPGRGRIGDRLSGEDADDQALQPGREQREATIRLLRRMIRNARALSYEDVASELEATLKQREGELKAR